MDCKGDNKVLELTNDFTPQQGYILVEKQEKNILHQMLTSN